MNDTIAINIKGISKLAFVEYSEEMLEIIKTLDLEFQEQRKPEKDISILIQMNMANIKD